MLYLKVPAKARVESKEDLKVFNTIVALFKKHGYGIASFNDTNVRFYDLSESVPAEGDGKRAMLAIPITSHYIVSKKEFLAFVDLMKKLDESEDKMVKMIKFYSGIL